MQHWSWGGNDIWKTGCISLHDTPAWRHYLCLAVDWLAYLTHWIKFPRWPRWYDNELGEYINPRDYWGDLGCLILCYWLTPLYNFEYKQDKGYHIEIGYDRLKEIFYERNKEYFDELEETTDRINLEEDDEARQTTIKN